MYNCIQNYRRVGKFTISAPGNDLSQGCIKGPCPTVMSYASPASTPAPTYMEVQEVTELEKKMKFKCLLMLLDRFSDTFGTRTVLIVPDIFGHVRDTFMDFFGHV